METDPHPCHIMGMTKHPKRPRDTNQLAKFIVDVATSQGGDTEVDSQKQGNKRHIGGLSGGPARAAALTPERRREIARKAASSRWGKDQAARGKKEPV